METGLLRRDDDAVGGDVEVGGVSTGGTGLGLRVEGLAGHLGVDWPVGVGLQKWFGVKMGCAGAR